MRKFARKCNATYSTSLRGTILRKHIATYRIQLNFNDVDISDLATFMGHADKIHREHYRQPLASRDIVKISQYLEAVQGHKAAVNLHRTAKIFQNKTLPIRLMKEVKKF